MKKKQLHILAGLVVMMSLLGVFKSFGESETKNLDFMRADPKLLRSHVTRLTTTPKPRDYTHPEILKEIAKYIHQTWTEQGLRPEFQDFKAGGQVYQNVTVSIGPEKAPRIVIGAHYDVAGNQPGADDNASGVAGLLELSRILKDKSSQLNHRIEFVAYCLEEPPFFGSEEMGSAVHAKNLKNSKTEIKLMMSLEMIGYFTEKENSQKFPVSALKYIYPNKGNFIAVVGDLGSFLMTRKIKNMMASQSKVDVEFLNAPKGLVGVDFSDHRNYWAQGYPAVMITDTAFFRNPNYHTPQDTIDTLNFEKMAEVVNGVSAVALRF